MSGQAHQTPLLKTDLQLCPRCGRPVLLLAPTVEGKVCTACYVELGRPAAVSTRTAHECEQETLRRMTARGGADLAAVRRGV